MLCCVVFITAEKRTLIGGREGSEPACCGDPSEGWHMSEIRQQLGWREGIETRDGKAVLAGRAQGERTQG